LGAKIDGLTRTFHTLHREAPEVLLRQGAAFDSPGGRVETLSRTDRTMQRGHSGTSGAAADEYEISGLIRRPHFVLLSKPAVVGPSNQGDARGRFLSLGVSNFHTSDAIQRSIWGKWDPFRKIFKKPIFPTGTADRGCRAGGASPVFRFNRQPRTHRNRSEALSQARRSRNPSKTALHARESRIREPVEKAIRKALLQRALKRGPVSGLGM